jgi:hypothetical protein
VWRLLTFFSLRYHFFWGALIAPQNRKSSNLSWQVFLVPEAFSGRSTEHCKPVGG